MNSDMITAESLDEMADLIRQEHPSLDTMLLSPVGEFQSRTVTLETLMREVTECLAENFRHRPAQDFPMLYFACGKARVGSTALSNLFGMAGMPSYYQPLKAILRDALVGRSLTPWIVPSAADTPCIFSKETIGPYVLAESLFNPLRLLIEAGYPRDRLHLIALDREPASALASWLDKLISRAPESTLLTHYVVAALSAARVASYAEQQGVPVTHYVYEASKDALSSVRVLFDRLGLSSRFTENAVTSWREPGQVQANNARVIFPSEASIYKVPNLHTSDSAYRYQRRATASLSEAQLDTLERCGVNDVYRASVKACASDLGLDPAASDCLFGGSLGHMTDASQQPQDQGPESPQHNARGLTQPAVRESGQAARHLKRSSRMSPASPNVNIDTTSDDALKRMADLIRCQDPTLDTMLLEPDGKYQTRTVTLDTLMRETTHRLAEGFKGRRPEDFPMHYCAWGKCRVGSTALNNLFGVAGLPSYYQPVKGILRHALVGSAASPWIIPPAAEQPDIFSKETAGPYVLAESLFNPLQCLIEAGYPADRLHAIILDRDPASSLASWLDKWSDRAPQSTLIYNYVIAALNGYRIEGYAKRHGIQVTHYVYEASKDAVATVHNLFDRLGLASRFTEDTVTAWNEMGQLESDSTRIIFSDVPAIHPTSGIHGSDTAYRYHARATGALSEAHLTILERCGVYDAYRASMDACVHDLGLDAATTERLFGGDAASSSIGGMSDIPVIASPPLAGDACGEAHHPVTSHLRRLESESIYILREVAAEFRKPVMLYSIGKDSSVLLHLVMKAFHPGKPPFPLLHVDTTWKFREMIAFRDQRMRELGLDLLVHSNPDGIAKCIGPFSHGSTVHTDVMKTQALRQALDLHGFDAAIGGARRDEEKSRAKERIFSHRSSAHRWDPKNQRPELWNLYNTLLAPGESMRVFPLSNWTELDIWEYIQLENIPIVPLYFAAQRPVVERDGELIMVDDERMPLRPGEKPQLRSVRFRTLGCYPLTGATLSTAATLPAVVEEMMGSRTSERQGRVIDRDSSGSMERKKVEGYF